MLEEMFESSDFGRSASFVALVEDWRPVPIGDFTHFADFTDFADISESVALFEKENLAPLELAEESEEISVA